MLWKEFFSAVALVLVFEGLMPFVRPNAWRSFVAKIVSQPDQSLRTMGLLSMLAGVFLLYAIR